MSTDNTGAPQQPSGADRPDQHADSTPARAEGHDAATPVDRADDSRAEQPTQRIELRQEQHSTPHPQEQATQQLPATGPDDTRPTAPQPAAPQAPASSQAPQPRYGQAAPGAPYGGTGQPYAQQGQGGYGQQYAQQGQGQPPYGHGAYGQPYGQQHQQAQHGQQAQNPYAPGPGGPGQHGAAAGAAPAGERRQRSVWVPVTAAALGAALLASLGTAAATGAFDDSSASSLADVGTDRKADEAPVSSSSDGAPDWEAVTDAVAPSVVAIQTQNSEGSGVVIDDKGHVLTNNHVVAGAENDIVQVSLADGRLYEATIVGTDPTTDLAVVQIKEAPDNLKPASLGTSEDVVVGDPVLAVGNPLGLANTATTGIVSALDRPVSASGEDGSTAVVTNAIQIDAAINPGNSGGPLFNSQGQVIGITSSIATLSGGMGGQSGSIGLGFAIPVDLAANIADQLIADGTAEHAFLGVSMTDGTATSDGVTRRGAEVVEVTPGSPAAEAGLKPGDVIVAIDDDSVNGAESLTAHVREKDASQKVQLTYVRDDETKTVDVTLALREEPEATGQGQEGQEGQDQGQGQDQEDQDGSQGSDPSQPDNLPGWLEDLLQGQGSGN